MYLYEYRYFLHSCLSIISRNVIARAIRAPDRPSQTNFPSLSSYFPRHLIQYIEPGMQKAARHKQSHTKYRIKSIPIDFIQERKHAPGTQGRERGSRTGRAINRPLSSKGELFETTWLESCGMQLI